MQGSLLFPALGGDSVLTATEYDGRFAVGASDRLGRGYASGDLLRSAKHVARRVHHLEDGPSRRQQDDEHRSHVTASILNSAGLLEATINESFDDVADGCSHGHVEAPAPVEVHIWDALAEVRWERPTPGPVRDALRPDRSRGNPEG